VDKEDRHAPFLLAHDLTQFFHRLFKLGKELNAQGQSLLRRVEFSVVSLVIDAEVYILLAPKDRQPCSHLFQWVLGKEYTVSFSVFMVTVPLNRCYPPCKQPGHRKQTPMAGLCTLRQIGPNIKHGPNADASPISNP